MTARELLKNKSGETYEFSPDCEVIPVSYAKECVRLKCEELLEIVAEKASKLPATIHYSATAPRYARLDKESILNVINLEEFIK